MGRNWFKPIDRRPKKKRGAQLAIARLKQKAGKLQPQEDIAAIASRKRVLSDDGDVSELFTFDGPGGISAQVIRTFEDGDATTPHLKFGAEYRLGMEFDGFTGSPAKRVSNGLYAAHSLIAIKPGGDGNEMMKPSHLKAIIKAVNPREGDLLFIPEKILDNSPFPVDNVSMKGMGFHRHVVNYTIKTRKVSLDRSHVYHLARMKDGKLVPVTKEDLDAGSEVREFRSQMRDVIPNEFGVGGSGRRRPSQDDLLRYYGQEDSLAEALAKVEDRFVGRKPTGRVPSLDDLRQEAVKWARSQGLEEGGAANGFTAEQTAAHDVAHPVTHRLAGMNSQQIWKGFGSVSQSDGKPSLLAEEAIVNVVEHLSRGDTLSASIANGVRLARVLSRRSNETDEGRSYVRSAEFTRRLEELAIQIYRHDDFSDYMTHVRATNRISKTVQQLGDDFTGSASGG